MNSLSFNLKKSGQHVLLTPDQMYAADRLAIQSGVKGTRLMANAGAVAAKALMQKWPRQNVLVICGTGNNGGDGFVIASLLKQAGWAVRLALFGDKHKIRGDAAWAASQWQDDILDTNNLELPESGIIVDAILRAGFNRPVAQDLACLISKINNSTAKVCSIDVPTGLNGANGACSSPTVKADLTVTFFRPKPGHYLLPGRVYCGDLVCENIGIKADVLDHIGSRTYRNHPALWLDKVHWPDIHDHKYARGHVLVFGGAKLLGAARLASLSAARIGAGLVTLAVPEQVWSIQAASMTSVMVENIADNVETNLRDQRRNTIIIGPGLGLDDKCKDMVLQVLHTGRACVIDADALSLFANEPDTLFSALHEKCVLTPHDGEFARLFDTNSDKLANIKNAVDKTGAVVLLKGADTVIGSLQGDLVINHNAPAFLATAGAGDVLAGCIAGLMANGMPAFNAACAGVWIHGQAANRAGYGLLAEDLPKELPKVLWSLSGNQEN